MAKTGSKAISEQLFYERKLLAKEHEKSLTGRALSKSDTAMARHVSEVGKSENFDEIIFLERQFLESDLADFITSAAQGTSVKTSLSEVDAAEKARTLVDDPVQYAAVNATHGHTKARSGGLPKDDMRMFLSSQNSRLLNMDKSKLSEAEKNIVHARRNNILKAQKLYIEMQRQALGLLSPDKARDKGLSQ